MSFAQEIQSELPIQGNLDPKRLIAGGRALDEGVDEILEYLAGGPLVFNLGHGITPDTPVDHVSQMVNRVAEFNSNSGGDGSWIFGSRRCTLFR